MSKDELIEYTLILWVENTDWDQEKVISKVAEALEVSKSKVQTVLDRINF